jgi:MFS family permease
MTAPVGWLAARYGRKPLYTGCLLGFTITSMLCGAAQSLGPIVVFRVLQGMFGAALVPLSQATLLDIYPPDRRGFAMAIWGLGVMLGPIMGPTVGPKQISGPLGLFHPPGPCGAGHLHGTGGRLAWNEILRRELPPR